MDSLMFKELVQSRVIPVLSIMLGSMFLASCSSGVSRFDFPMFGLSSTDDKDPSTSSLPLAPTIEPSANDLTRYSNDSGLAGFENDRGASSVARSSTNYNTRNSYLPPQTAAPEVRAARYGSVNRAPASNAGGQYSRNKTADTRRPSRYDAVPMKPIVEARRSFLPSEPRGYNYNSQPNIKPRAGHDIGSKNMPMRAINKTADGATSVTVSTGDTLYSIGRRHNISIVELMELNGLADSNLTVGQRLKVPGGAKQNVVRSNQAVAASRMKARTSGTYTVRPGESFQNIAKKHGVSSAQLANLNGITDPGSIRAGEVLILPTRANPVRKMKKVVRLTTKRPSELKVHKVKTQTINLGSSKKLSSTIAKKKQSVKQQSVAMKKPTKKGAVSTAFRWPVRGRIIGKFGPRSDGTHNDGINLAVPNGTKVKAAESGVVAYAGSELEGYGNLVLIRHANDWVSAYAHNDKLMVKRGEKIKRGQIIARAGTSGSVEVPQVHFELRKASKPVDPTNFMAGT